MAKKGFTLDFLDEDKAPKPRAEETRKDIPIETEQGRGVLSEETVAPVVLEKEPKVVVKKSEKKGRGEQPATKPDTAHKKEAPDTDASSEKVETFTKMTFEVNDEIVAIISHYIKASKQTQKEFINDLFQREMDANPEKLEKAKMIRDLLDSKE